MRIALTFYSVHVTVWLLLKYLKEAENRQGEKKKVLYMLMTDGTAEISAQAWGQLGITLNTQINVGHTKKKYFDLQ